MRICVVVHGFPPLERTGVENYTASLAAAFTRAGHRVEVFVPRKAEGLPELSLRREERDGYGITWLTTNQEPRDPEEQLDLPGVAERFGDFLDRERPEIVHFQHVIKLGVGLIDEAARRSIPTVYTAHDYYPICHRFTLLRPDLSRCDTLADSEACARCDLALAWLNRLPELGDYQMGALPEQLETDAAAGLRGVLLDGVGDGCFSEEERRAAYERRRALDEVRGEAFAKLDLVVAPTRFLAAKLREGGLRPKRLEHLPYGIETEELAGIAPPGRRNPDAPVRFGFLGGLSKHKGVHVLLAAFDRLEEGAELAIWGGSSDRPYVARMQELARAAGATWHGPYTKEDLSACLAQVDIVVVPSIWYENYPIVIREAFAAGRPVITSDVGALPESVRDGVDGLLVPPGDAEALADAMRRFVEEPGLLAQLRAGIARVADARSQVRDLEALYQSIVAERDSSLDPKLPPHLKEIAERWSELARMPLRDLLQQVLSGLHRLREALPGVAERAPIERLLGDALASGSRAQLTLRDLKREKEWLRETLSSHEEAQRALERRLEWREGQLADEETELVWLRGLVEDMKSERAWLKSTVEHQESALEESHRALEAKERELEWLRGLVSSKDEEVEWLRGVRESHESELEWLRGRVDDLGRELNWRRDTEAGNVRELEWLRERTAGQAEELDRVEERERWFQAEIAGLEAQVAARGGELEESVTALDRVRQRFRQAAEVGLVALQTQQRVFGHELRPLLEALEAAVSEPGTPEPDSDAAGLGGMLAGIKRGIRLLRQVDAELRWRRQEMRGAVEEMRRPLARYLVRRTGVGRRVIRWEHSLPVDGPPPAPPPRAAEAKPSTRPDEDDDEPPHRAAGGERP